MGVNPLPTPSCITIRYWFAVYVDDLAKSCDCTRAVYLDFMPMIYYFCRRQSLSFRILYVTYLDALNLVIGLKGKKSCCTGLRIGQRSRPNVKMCLRSLSGAFLPWSTEIRYLCVHMSNLKVRPTRFRRTNPGDLFTVLLTRFLVQ